MEPYSFGVQEYFTEACCAVSTTTGEGDTPHLLSFGDESDILVFRGSWLLIQRVTLDCEVCLLDRCWGTSMLGWNKRSTYERRYYSAISHR